MSNNWILDVLADLKAFADQNGLAGLSLCLDEAAVTAAAELASRDPERVDTGNEGEALPRQGSGRVAFG